MHLKFLFHKVKNQKQNTKLDFIQVNKLSLALPKSEHLMLTVRTAFKHIANKDKAACIVVNLR